MSTYTAKEYEWCCNVDEKFGHKQLSKESMDNLCRYATDSGSNLLTTRNVVSNAEAIFDYLEEKFKDTSITVEAYTLKAHRDALGIWKYLIIVAYTPK